MREKLDILHKLKSRWKKLGVLRESKSEEISVLHSAETRIEIKVSSWYKSKKYFQRTGKAIPTPRRADGYRNLKKVSILLNVYSSPCQQVLLGKVTLWESKCVRTEQGKHSQHILVSNLIMYRPFSTTSSNVCTSWPGKLTNLLSISCKTHLQNIKLNVHFS